MKSVTTVLILQIYLISCFIDTELAPCSSSSNCPKDQYCSKSDNRCHKTDFMVYSCEESNCSENEFCYPIDKTCHLLDEVGLFCNNSYDCPRGQICNDEKICILPDKPQCSEPKDCLKANVESANCLDGVCTIEKCSIGFTDKDFDYSNGCENMLPCSDNGFNPYERCSGNNVCKCDSDCIMLSGYYGIDYDKGLCLRKCAVTDINKTFGNMLCNCTATEMGVCKKANLFEIATLSGQIKAKLLDNCNEFIKDSATFQDINLTLGGITSSYNRGSACKKYEDGKPIINITLFKICSILPCKDIISIDIPQNIHTGQTLSTNEVFGLKASIEYTMKDNQVFIKEVWFNAISWGGFITVENNGSEISKIIQLRLDLKMIRYDIPYCGEIVRKECVNL